MLLALIMFYLFKQLIQTYVTLIPVKTKEYVTLNQPQVTPVCVVKINVITIGLGLTVKKILMVSLQDLIQILLCCAEANSSSFLNEKVRNYVFLYGRNKVISLKFYFLLH